MEDSFKLRVNKIFGSLSSSSSPSAVSSSLWSLTDEEIEKREWDRDKGRPVPESTPYPSNLDGFFSNQREQQHRRTVTSDNKCLSFSSEIEEDLADLNDEVDDDVDVSGSSKQPAKPEDHDDEEWQIRSSVGLDCTLDFEEEEDEYDKLAVGQEKAGDRVYMSEFNDYGTCSNSHNELPITLNEAVRDSRANHMAAKLRLKQDAEAAGSFDSLTVSENTQPAITGAQVNTATDGNLKSILKRKENPSDSKLQKRVRFDPECKNDLQEESENADEVAKEKEATVSNEASLVPQDHPGVPDYVRNPSKYTCYTFDSSSEVDEESNRRAYMDFLNLVRKSNTMERQPEDAFVDLPKSVTFTPRKKTGDATNVKNSRDYNRNEEDAGKGPTPRKGLPISIAKDEVEGSEVCDMDEDEPETVAENSNGSRKPGRQYRSKVRSELDHIV